MLMNVKMPTIVGILTFMSRIVELSMKKKLITSGPVHRVYGKERVNSACSFTQTSKKFETLHVASLIILYVADSEEQRC